MRGLVCCLVLLWAAIGATTVPALTVLIPADDHRASGDTAWLVVEAVAPPLVSVDGRDLPPPRGEAGVYHVRLESLRPEGSEVVVRGDGSPARLKVFGVADEPHRFHETRLETCVRCHDPGESGCLECHRWEGAKHAPLLARGCTRCHQPPGWKVADVTDSCIACHDQYAGGKHPRLRHSLESPRDPLRPYRKMHCASCHDPHTPRCLSCLGRGDLRKWCLRCHSQP